MYILLLRSFTPHRVAAQTNQILKAYIRRTSTKEVTSAQAHCDSSVLLNKEVSAFFIVQMITSLCVPVLSGRVSIDCVQLKRA